MNTDPVFIAVTSGMSATRAAKHLKMPLSTVKDRVRRMVERGIITRRPNGSYQPGPHAAASSGLAGTNVPVGGRVAGTGPALRVHARQWRFRVRWANVGAVAWSGFPGRRRADGSPSQFSVRDGGALFVLIPGRAGELGTLIVNLPERLTKDPEGEEECCRADAEAAVRAFATRYGFKLAPGRGERVGRLQYGVPVRQQPLFGDPNRDGVYADGSLQEEDPSAPVEFEMVPGRAASPDVRDTVTVAHVSTFMRAPMVERVVAQIADVLERVTRPQPASMGKPRELPPELDPGVA